jgi:hypothetical protein
MTWGWGRVKRDVGGGKVCERFPVLLTVRPLVVVYVTGLVSPEPSNGRGRLVEVVCGDSLRADMENLSKR